MTKSLLSLIRQQRHLAMRVIISTQGKPFVNVINNFHLIALLISEPTVVPPVLLDLCTVSILHRFSSPAWWQHLIQHVSADFSHSDAFDKIVRLQVSYSDARVHSRFSNSLSRQGKRLFSLLRALGYLRHLRVMNGTKDNPRQTKPKYFRILVVVTL